MTDEELDAPDEVYDTMMEVQRNPTGAWQAIHDQADTITTLRAQLAEAQKDGSQLAAWQCLFDDGKTGIVCDDWGNQYCAMQRRADRAEAALAAQIEADAEICDGMQSSTMYYEAHECANAIRAQPHDRTALDRHDAKTREKALREAAQACDWGDIYGDNAVRTILALIDKEKAE